MDIAGLGRQGDGMARAEGRSLAIPFALPGERVRVEGEPPRMTAVLRSSRERATPPCRHFGRCGGCRLQHMDRDAILRWKRDRVATALRREGLGAVDVAQTLGCQPHSRRRVALSVARRGDEIALGFRARGSHEIVDMVECHVATPAIVAALPDLRACAATLLSGARPAVVSVTDCREGLDVAFALPRPMGEGVRSALVRVAARGGFARLSVDGEIVLERAHPTVAFATTAIVPPPGAFLQAVASIEDAMAARVLAHLAGAGRVADLFAGCGTFALRLAPRADVHAVEGDAAALEALRDGARDGGQGFGTVTTERRDLFAEPLVPSELRRFDGLVLDPPRAGAADQATHLAASGIARIAYVSCNPETLARDLATLTAGGYRVREVTPFDQFLWSPHTEVVALLERLAPKTPRRSIFR